MVLGVIGHLLGTACVGGVDGGLHGGRNLIGIHYGQAVEISRRTAHCLSQGTLRAEETLLVGIEDCDERDLGHIETLAEHIDANEDIKDAFAKFAHNLDTLKGIHIGVDICALDTEASHILTKLLGHAFGKGSYESALTKLDAFVHLFHEVVHLIEALADFNYRVEEARRAHNLLYHHASGLLELVVRGSSRDVDNLVCHLLKLLELQRAIVARGAESETEIDKALLALAVAAIHGVDLWDGHVTLVYNEQKVLWEIVEQAIRAFVLFAAIKITGVVLDAGAVAELLDHLDVVCHTLFETVSLHLLVVATEFGSLANKVVLDMAERIVHLILGRDKKVCGEDCDLINFREGVGGDGIDGLDALNLIAEENEAIGKILVCHIDIYRVALDAEITTVEGHFVARILRILELAHKGGGRDLLPYLDSDNPAIEILRVAQTVEARDGGDHNDVAPTAHECHRRAQSEFIKLLVYREVLLDICIRGGYVGLGLIVIVVRDEILHGVLGEEGLELLVELGGESLIMAEDKGRALGLRYDVGNGERLSRACHTQQHLRLFARVDTLHELPNCLGLVARGFVW